MTNREKVLKGLECLSDENNICSKDTCPYYMFEGCVPEISHDALELLKKQPQWISVEDRLPENAKHLGAFCPRYYVQTEFGMTEGWYNPDRGKWYVLLWFIYAQPGLYLPRFVDLEHGDIPLVSDKVKVSHWMPLPEPPEVLKHD